MEIRGVSVAISIPLGVYTSAPPMHSDSFLADQLPGIDVHQGGLVDDACAADVPQVALDLFEREIRVHVMRVVGLSRRRTMLAEDLFVGAEDDEPAAGAQNTQPFAEDGLRIDIVLEQVGAVDKVEDAVAKPV